MDTVRHKLKPEELAELQAIMKDYSAVCERWDSWCMDTFKGVRLPRVLRLFDRKLVRVWHLFDRVVDEFDYTKVKPHG